MIHHIGFLPEARDDIEKARRWYEDRRPGLGDEFLLAVEAQCAAIDSHPLSYPLVYLDGRKAWLRRFPYIILFYVHDDTVVIVSVHHTSRDPRHWQQRYR